MNLFYLTSMPRAGNTLFGSLMNQNPNIKITPNSLCALLLNNILNIKQDQLFRNFPDYRGVDNIIKNFFKNYYEHYECNNILDRGPWGLRQYYKIIKELNKDIKFVILYRPFLEILTSFVLKDKPKNIDVYCDDIVGYQYASVIMDNLNSIRNLIRFKENFLVVHYKDLVTETDKELKKVCDFLNIPFVKPDYKNIQQFNIKGFYYDDTCLSEPLHTIDTTGIKYINHNIETILSKEVINRYKNFDVNFN